MIRAEDLILSKLEWSKMGESERQVRDAATVMQKRSGQLNGDYLEKWAKEIGLTEHWNAACKLAGLP
jgi:hypothetical protein